MLDIKIMCSWTHDIIKIREIKFIKIIDLLHVVLEVQRSYELSEKTGFGKMYEKLLRQIHTIVSCLRLSTRHVSCQYRYVIARHFRDADRFCLYFDIIIFIRFMLMTMTLLNLLSKSPLRIKFKITLPADASVAFLTLTVYDNR